MQAVFDDKVAQLLPPKHCAFQNCTWQLEWQSSENMTERLREQRLLDHVMTDHKSDIAEAACLFPLCFSKEERFAAAYNEAIAIKVRQGAPLASYSIDRKCLRKASIATSGDNIQALICFICARVFPHREHEVNQDIQWTSPFATERLLYNCTKDDAEKFFGLETYLKNYGKDPLGFYDLNRHMTEFSD